MNSPYVHLRHIVQGLFTSGNGEGGSEQIREGAFTKTYPKPHTLDAAIWESEKGRIDLGPRTVGIILNPVK